MKCEYCKMTEIQNVINERVTDIRQSPNMGHLICDECFEYLNTFCELEEALAAAKAENMNLKIRLGESPWTSA